MRSYSACVEWLFATGGDPIDGRIRLAAAAGFAAVEFWCWNRHDLDAVAAALRETGIRLNSFHAEPHGQLTDPSTHREFLAGVRRSCEVAQRLGATGLVVFSGAAVPGMSVEHQLAAVSTALRDAASIAQDSGITLLLEPLNTTDSPGYFAASVAAAARILRRVDRPGVRLQFDAYHSAMEHEDPLAVLPPVADLLAHVQVSDVPGRVAPGLGTIDWARVLGVLGVCGYDGLIGLEYRPSDGAGEPAAVLRLLERSWPAPV